MVFSNLGVKQHRQGVGYSRLHKGLFAARANSKLPMYVSPIPDPMSWREDAFQLSLDILSIYAYPPFDHLGRVLLRVMLSWSHTMALVAPLWPQRSSLQTLWLF